jgi:xanthine dehydrogenase accessory factor
MADDVSTPIVANDSQLAEALSAGPAETDWPLYGVADDVRAAIAEIIASGAPGALATLVGVDGPSPRPLGAQMAIAADGRVSGHVSGGCVEGSVAILGNEVAQAGTPRHVTFGAGSPFADVKLICGARIEVFIERISTRDETLRAVLEARTARQPIVRTVAKDGAAHTQTPAEHEAVSGVDENTGAVWRRYDPPTRLIVLGHDPVALATAQLGRTIGLETILVRRLGPGALPPGIASRYLSAAPVAAMSELKLDAWTAIVTTTHDLEDDHEALEYALPSPAFYVGALGSRRRVADRIAKLEKAGLDWEAVRRLKAPVGLDIGAATPMEIALSILADVVRAQRQGLSSQPSCSQQAWRAVWTAQTNCCCPIAAGRSSLTPSPPPATQAPSASSSSPAATAMKSRKPPAHMPS